MINHLRTLLLAADGDASPGYDYPGEEYVPAEFRAATMIGTVNSVRNALFGPNADRAMRNYRLRQVLTLLHSTELAQYVLDLDPRVTYWPLHSDGLARAFAFGAAAKQSAGDTCGLSFLGSPDSFVSLGRIYHQWLVTVLVSNQVRVERVTEPYTITLSSYTMTDGWSDNVSLNGSNLSVKFSTPGGDLPSWIVSGLAHPAHEPMDALNDMQVAGVDELLAGNTEPYKSLRALWEQQTMPAIYRLGVAALALGYRMNERYQQR